MILADHQIRALAQWGMIDPYAEISPPGVISYGLSSYGYDARLAPDFKVFHNLNNSIVDPKNFKTDSFIDRTGDFCVIPPNSFILGRTVEKFLIPDDVLVICIGKSTYARCGIKAEVTPLEPGWGGVVTLELSNTSPCPAIVYANEGIIQMTFHRGDACEKTYRDKKGKYQGQTGITLPRISKPEGR